MNRDGAFAEYLCIPASNVVPIPDGIPEDVVSFFDALGNATHIALMFDVIGEDVLITGAGPIGMMATAICRRNGARSVVVTDVNDYRLEMARKMGATATVNVAHDKLESIFGPQHMVEGFDVGLEMSGNVAALNTMIDNMRNGGKISLQQLQAAKDSTDMTTMDKLASYIGVSTVDAAKGDPIMGTGLTLQIGDTSDSYNQLTVDIQDMHAGCSWYC